MGAEPIASIVGSDDIVVGDFDGDGVIDIAVYDEGEMTIDVWSLDGVPRLLARVVDADCVLHLLRRLPDASGDGIDDLVSFCWDLDETVVIPSPLGGGSRIQWRSAGLPVSDEQHQVVSAFQTGGHVASAVLPLPDVNGDGVAELLIRNDGTFISLSPHAFNPRDAMREWTSVTPLEFLALPESVVWGQPFVGLTSEGDIVALNLSAPDGVPELTVSVLPIATVRVPEPGFRDGTVRVFEVPRQSPATSLFAVTDTMADVGEPSTVLLTDPIEGTVVHTVGELLPPATSIGDATVQRLLVCDMNQDGDLDLVAWLRLQNPGGVEYLAGVYSGPDWWTLPELAPVEWWATGESSAGACGEHGLLSTVPGGSTLQRTPFGGL